MPAVKIPPDHPQTKDDFFAHEAKTWAVLIATWRGLPEVALLWPGANGEAWSIKDIMNHVAAWQEAAIRATGELMAGRWAQLGANTDKFNAKTYELDKDRSLAATRKRLNKARRDLLEVLATTPAKKLLNIYGRQQIGWWAKYSTYGHYGEHIPKLQDFRKMLLISSD
jgi:hypothetical protein